MRDKYDPFLSPTWRTKKELEVADSGTMESADFGALAVHMTRMIEKNVVDRELRTWIMPAFSTTTDSDHVVAVIQLMGVCTSTSPTRYRFYVEFRQ